MNRIQEMGVVVWVQSGQKLDTAVRVETNQRGKDAMNHAMAILDPFSAYNASLLPLQECVDYFSTQYLRYWEGVAEDVAIGSHHSCVQVCA